MSGVKKHSS